MKILIIGCKGFIGSHCMKYFSDGNEIFGCDIVQSDEKNYFQIKPGNVFTEIFLKEKFDLCINAAGSAHVNYSFEFPERDFELNVSLVINILGALKNYSPECKLINFSSAAVYGNPVNLPISENEKTNPLSPYGYHKLISEEVLTAYHRFFNLATCSLRVFSAYGEGLKKQLFWDLYTKIKNSDSIELFGTGNESRDFIYIKDLLKILELMIKKAAFTGEIYNLANGSEVRIEDAVKIFLNKMNWKGEILFTGKEKLGDPINWKADINKITSLGYIRQFSFEEGVENYCSWLTSLK